MLVTTGRAGVNWMRFSPRPNTSSSTVTGSASLVPAAMRRSSDPPGRYLVLMPAPFSCARMSFARYAASPSPCAIRVTAVRYDDAFISATARCKASTSGGVSMCDSLRPSSPASCNTYRPAGESPTTFTSLYSGNGLGEMAFASSIACTW